MISPTPKDLFEAIMTTSADVVENYLQNSSEHTTLLANANLASFLPIWQTIVDSLGHVHPNCIAATNGTPFDSISALHLAILSCVSHETNPTLFDEDDSALRIVQTLLSRGANAELETNGIYIAVTGPNRHQKNLAVVENGTTPLQLAVLVKKYMHPPSQQQPPKAIMNQVTSLLLSHHQANKSTNKDSQHGSTIPKTQVPTSVYQNWNKLLINSEFADVMFECADGTTFVAHKCVLAACSTYFQNYFSGPWSKHHAQGGVWKTTNSSPVMWAILKYMYTGQLDVTTVVQQHAAEFLSVSKEYMLDDLYRISETSCIQQLSLETIKSFLLLGHLHDSQPLLEACFDFVRNNAARTLTDPDIVTLAQEHATLWNKLRMAVSNEEGTEKK